MKIHSLAFCLICALFAGCVTPERIDFVPRATAPGENVVAHRFRFLGDAARTVDHSTIWRIDGFGQEVFFPVHRDFALHSPAIGDRLVTMSWTGWNEQGREEPTEFSAGLINHSGLGKRFSLDSVVNDSVIREAGRCSRGYQRRVLTVSGDQRRAELSYCPQLKSGPIQEIALHVTIDHDPVIFTTHWVRREPLSTRIDLDDTALLNRIDRMNDVVFCAKYDGKQDVMCDHLRTLYLTGDRLYRALSGK